MKTTIITILLATLIASCGKHRASNSTVDVPTVQVTNESILNKFKAVTVGLHGINDLDYTQVQLGVPTADTNCNGTFGNSGDVNGVASGYSLMSGTTESGTLQFGNLAYRNATPVELMEACKAISKEGYTYQMNGDTMTLCMINYPFCADYKVVK